MQRKEPFTTGSFPAAQFSFIQQPVVTANNVPIPVGRDFLKT